MGQSVAANGEEKTGKAQDWELARIERDSRLLRHEVERNDGKGRGQRMGQTQVKPP